MKAEILVLPDDWQFYQADLSYEGGHVCVAAEPHGSGQDPTVTLVVTSVSKYARDNATLYLTAAEAAEIWTALGAAIRTASGCEPKPAKLIEN